MICHFETQKETKLLGEAIIAHNMLSVNTCKIKEIYVFCITN